MDADRRLASAGMFYFKRRPAAEAQFVRSVCGQARKAAEAGWDQARRGIFGAGVGERKKGLKLLVCEGGRGQWQHFRSLHFNAYDTRYFDEDGAVKNLTKLSRAIRGSVKKFVYTVPMVICGRGIHQYDEYKITLF